MKQHCPSRVSNCFCKFSRVHLESDIMQKKAKVVEEFHAGWFLMFGRVKHFLFLHIQQWLVRLGCVSCELVTLWTGCSESCVTGQARAHKLG